MPNPHSELKTVTLVLTVEQANRLREIKDQTANDYRRVSLSDIAREVVARGLESYNRDGDTGSGATAVQLAEAA